MGLIEHELGDPRINYAPDAFTGGLGSENLDGYKKLGEFPVEKGPTLVLRKGMRGINLAWETPLPQKNFLPLLDL